MHCEVGPTGRRIEIVSDPLDVWTSALLATRYQLKTSRFLLGQ